MAYKEIYFDFECGSQGNAPCPRPKINGSQNRAKEERKQPKTIVQKENTYRRKG